MKFLLTVYGGERYPQGYGLAWRNMDRDSVTCAPLPFNQVLGSLRQLYLRLQYRNHSALDKALLEAYYAGYHKGRESWQP